MRRLLLAATWLVGTLFATLVVYAAVGAVTGQVTPARTEPISQTGVQRALGASTPASTSPSPTATPAATPTASAPPSTPTPVSGGGRPTPPPPPPPPPPSATNTRTFAAVGGTASFSCSGSQISLNWATPNSGFQVDDIGSSNGGAQIEVRFRSSSHESRVQAWCAGGQVQGTTQEEAS